MTYQLAIGNKTLSSWSARPWMVLTQFGLPFEEVLIRLRRAEFREEVKPHSPSGLVPCLRDGDLFIWDSLAIAEYLAEQHPEKALWPTVRAARAMARCVTAEMHSGFSHLRSTWPMDLSVVGAGVICPTAVRKDLDRIFDLWVEMRAKFGCGGSFLFGDFSIADAFFVPVVLRLRTYGPVKMPIACAEYMAAVLALPAVQSWIDGAKNEITAGWYA